MADKHLVGTETNTELSNAEDLTLHFVGLKSLTERKKRIVINIVDFFVWDNK